MVRQTLGNPVNWSGSDLPGQNWGLVRPIPWDGRYFLCVNTSNDVVFLMIILVENTKLGVHPRWPNLAFFLCRQGVLRLRSFLGRDFLKIPLWFYFPFEASCTMHRHGSQ